MPPPPLLRRWFATWGLVFHLRVWFMLATAIPPTEDMRCRFGPKPVIENWGQGVVGAVCMHRAGVCGGSGSRLVVVVEEVVFGGVVVFSFVPMGPSLH